MNPNFEWDEEKAEANLRMRAEYDLGAIALISLVGYRNKKPFWVRFSGLVGISTTRTVSTSDEMVPSPMSP